MKNYDDFELNCKDDCDSCEVKLECEYLTADGEAKKAALTKLVERDEKEEAARKAEESAEAADEITEQAEEQAEEEKPVEEITEEVTEENGETVETEEVIDTSSPAEELAEAADEATEEAEEQAEEEKPVEEITEEVTEENGETVETKTVIDTVSPAEELAEAADEATEEAEEQAEEQTAEEVEESILETAEDIDAPEEVQPTNNEATAEQTQPTEEAAEEKTEEEQPATTEEKPTEDEQPATEEMPTEEEQTSEVAAQDTEAEEVAEKTEEQAEEQTEQAEEEKPAKSAFKLTPPENLEELYAAMCTKRARKLIFRPAEAIYDKTFKVLGTDKKNEEGIKVKDILDAEIKQGVKLGYIDKFDGLKTSEIKEEYENDVVYEYAEQEFKKVGLIYDGKKIKVYVYDFDGKACHHVGYIDETEAADVIPYLIDKEKYSFALDGIITGGKAKRVTKDENGKITITKEKDGNIGLELDVTIIPRKD